MMRDKTFKKLVKKSVPEFNRKVYFNKKFREKVLRDFTDLSEWALRTIENASNINSLEDSTNRLLVEKMLDVSIRYIKFCNTAERRQKYYNQRGSFILYQKDKVYVFNIKTLRDKKIREGNLIFQNGLPSAKYKIAVLRKKVMDLDGFSIVDSGKLHLKQMNFNEGYYHFWGKKRKYFINFVIRKIISNKNFSMKAKDVSLMSPAV